jgi:hypothetical protein
MKMSNSIVALTKDLRSANRPDLDRHYSNRGWIALLYMAEAYGWQPMGNLLCTPSGNVPWEGGRDYSGNDPKVVTAEDAANFAAALARAIDDGCSIYPEDERTIRLEAAREMVETAGCGGLYIQ